MKPDTYTAQGAENAGRKAYCRGESSELENPYPRGTTDWRSFEHGWAIQANIDAHKDRSAEQVQS